MPSPDDLSEVYRLLFGPLDRLDRAFGSPLLRERTEDSAACQLDPNRVRSFVRSVWSIESAPPRCSIVCAVAGGGAFLGLSGKTREDAERQTMKMEIRAAAVHSIGMR